MTDISSEVSPLLVTGVPLRSCSRSVPRLLPVTPSLRIEVRWERGCDWSVSKEGGATGTGCTGRLGVGNGIGSVTGQVPGLLSPVYERTGVTGLKPIPGSSLPPPTLYSHYNVKPSH